MQVEIRVGAQIDLDWSEWFEGLAIRHVGEREAVLVGTLADQAALHGVLARLRDLGLPLKEVRCTGG